MPLFRAPDPCKACGWTHYGACAPHDDKAVAARRRLDNHNAKWQLYYMNKGSKPNREEHTREEEVLERRLASAIKHANKERKGVRARAKKGRK